MCVNDWMDKSDKITNYTLGLKPRETRKVNIIEEIQEINSSHETYNYEGKT